MGIAHFDDAPQVERANGHLRARWTNLGQAAGSAEVGLRRIEVREGGWSTPVHDHGRSEEIFYVLSGKGLSWHNGHAAEIGAGDCVVYLAGRGAHTLHALEPLDVLAFGMRDSDASLRLPRIGLSLVGGRAVESAPGLVDGVPIQFVREQELGPPELPASPSRRPPSIVNVADVEPESVERPRVSRARRNLGRAAGSVRTGLQHIQVAPGRLSTPQHCHSMEEEIFVILGGDGMLLLGEEEIPVGPGHVIARPAATRVAHAFRAGPGEAGLTLLAYGTREDGDVCWFPRSRKVAFRGVGVIARVEPVGLWEGED